MNATSERFLLDASVWIGARQPGSRYYEECRALVVDPAYPVAALDLTMHEVANALGARDDRSDEAIDMCRLIDGRCGDAIVYADPMLIRSALRFADEHRLTAYDAAYVATSHREEWRLISLDIKHLVSKELAVTPDAAV